MTILSSSAIIDTVVNVLGLLVATISMVATVITMLITKNDLKPTVQKIRNNIGISMERAKKELIYKKHFKDSNISESEFEEAVKDAYADIMLLMPYLDKQGKQDEDWYLGEWLCNERPYYENIISKDKKEVAHLVYTIRKDIY